MLESGIVNMLLKTYGNVSKLGGRRYTKSKARLSRCSKEDIQLESNRILVRFEARAEPDLLM